MASKPTRTAPLNVGQVAKRQSENGGGKPEKIELLAIPAPLLMAAESVASRAPKDREELHAILLHFKEGGVGRIVATDGFRYFIGSFAVKPVPSWLKTGIMVEANNLKARINMVSKVGKSAYVILAHAKGAATVAMADQANTMRFEVNCSAVSEMWPYEDAIQVGSFTDMDDEGEQRTRPEFDPIGFHSRHMKEVGEISKILEAGLDKDDRDPNGMVVRIHQAAPDSPRIFMFDGWDGALLVVGALKLPTRPLPLLTSRVLEPATKGTLAALRAHASRWRDAAEAADSEELRAACLAKCSSFELRVAAILQRAPERQALPAPAAEDAKPEATEGESEEAPAVTTAERAAATKRKRARQRAATVLH
jgi:hypothetical protein